jgi:AcrR family transcriptional regulator
VEIMGLQRGERQAQRTKEALENAFVELTHEKNYDAITINEIIERANTGRSTFYRYFQSKADILLSLHEGIFARFSLGLASASDWLADEPPPPLVRFLEQFEPYGRLRMSFAYKLGKDVDYVVPRIDELLIRQFEESLRCSFSEDASRIPFEVLARSIAGTYSWLIRAWFTEPRTLTADQVARYIHNLSRAAIREAFGLEARS